jgi:hypothetical protein
MQDIILIIRRDVEYYYLTSTVVCSSTNESRLSAFLCTLIYGTRPHGTRVLMSTSLPSLPSYLPVTPSLFSAVSLSLSLCFSLSLSRFAHRPALNGNGGVRSYACPHSPLPPFVTLRQKEGGRGKRANEGERVCLRFTDGLPEQCPAGQGRPSA